MDTEFDIANLDTLPQVDIVYGYANIGRTPVDALVGDSERAGQRWAQSGRDRWKSRARWRIAYFRGKLQVNNRERNVKQRLRRVRRATVHR